MLARIFVLSTVAFIAGLFLRSAEATDTCFVRLAPAEEIGWTLAFQPHGDALLVGADRGLFQFEGADLRRLAREEETGGVTKFQPHGDALLVGAGRGLFQLDGADLRRLALERETGGISEFQPHGGVLLVGAERGLFQLEGADLRRLAQEEETGGVTKFQPHGDALVVNTERGLFQLDGADLRRLAPAEETGNISQFQPYGDALLVSTERGLFQLDGAGLRRLAQKKETGEFFKFQPYGDALLVGTVRGLFQLEGADLRRLAPAEETGEVFKFQPYGDAVVVGTERGLFQLEGADLRRLAQEEETGEVFKFQPHGDAHLVGTVGGLFQLEGGDFRRLAQQEETGRISEFQPYGDALLVAAERGLFAGYFDVPLESAQAELEQALVDASRENSIWFRLTVRYPCVFAWSPDEITLLTADTAEPLHTTSRFDVLLSEDEPMRATITGQIDFEQRGNHRVRLAFAHDGAEPVLLSEPIEFRLERTGWDYAKLVANRGWPFLLAAHTLLFVGLIAGARWSDQCWRLLTDPVWGRFGLWFHVALRHLGPLQRWIMARWFDRVRRSPTSRPYLPVSLATETGEVVASPDLLKKLFTKRCLWLQGNPGMGKTALMAHLAEQFFTKPELPSLFAAYRHFGFVPIFVELREFAAIPPDDAHPERWVPELARAAVAADGVAFGNADLFRAIIASGAFGVVLDGANEVGHGRELELFAKATPAVRVLVASQALPAYVPGAFETLRLPATIDDAIGPLLHLFLGDRRGDEVQDRIKGSPLLSAIRSGYDVRLLADLAPEGADLDRLPDDRPGLYEAILTAVRMPDGSPYPVDQLSDAAWRMWRDGERKLRADGAYLSADLLEPLRGEGNRVVRALDGEAFEFRHDQMRGYLAARWAVQHEVAPTHLFETDARIWRLGRSEQVVVWGFAADLIEPERGVDLWRWATRDPERAVLQHALQERGETEGWPLHVPSTFAAE